MKDFYILTSNRGKGLTRHLIKLAYEQGREDQRTEDNNFFNFDAVIEIEKKKSYDQAIDDCKKSIVNTESKVVNPCANKSWETLTLLADRQFEILSILEQLKERK